MAEPAIFDMDSPVGIVGAGRLGSSLAVAMSRAGYKIACISTRREQHREWLTSQLPSATVTASAQEVADSASIIFITTSDATIKAVAESVHWHDRQAVIHCSGAAPVAQLETAARYGAVTGGFHPLQTFPSPEAADSFKGVTFGIESADEPLNSWLHTLANDLGGTPIAITAEQRPAYHAAAVMACGLLAGLTGLAAEVWASTGGVTREQAVDSLAPLVKSTANWIAKNGLPEALTGPYVRGDVNTVEAHVAASSGTSPGHGAAYSALALAALHIAKEQGGLSDEAEASIREILTISLESNCEIIDRP